MKKIINLLFIIYLPLIAGTITRTVMFTDEDLLFKKVNGYDVIELKGYLTVLNPGEPRLPRVVQSLLIPAGALPVSVELVADEWVEMPGKYYIVPAQPDVPLPMPGKTFTPKEYPPDLDIYSSYNLYPDKKIELIGSGNMNGYRIAHIELFPIRYKPAKGVLIMATSITYRLTYAEHQVSDFTPSIRQKEIFAEAVRGHVVNPQDIVYCAPRVAGTGIGLSVVPPGYYEYVVISESPMDTVFQRLADWKTKKGVPATVVLVSWINSNYAGYDLQEKIRNFIIDARNNWGTIYVLLGGSGDYNSAGQNIVPTRKGWYTLYGGPDNDSLPADLYYSDLDGNWDFDGDHTYGELGDSVDMYADVYVGRASVYNIAMAQNFVYKVLTYERNPPVDYIEKLMLPAAIIWPSYDERPMQDSIFRIAPSDWQKSKMYERNGNLSRPSMIDTMNIGYHFGHWAGHGSEDGVILLPNWWYLHISDINYLNNGDRVGIVNCISCLCGAWDLTPGSDCFAERLVNRVGGGLVATMMNARYGWGAWIGYYVPGPSERIDTTFYAKLFTENNYYLGATHAAAKDAWVPYADYGAPYAFTRWCIYELNLLGDPEMPVWTDEPMFLTAEYPTTIFLGGQSITVTVMSDGNPVDNVLVCLQQGTEVYKSGYTNISGEVTLNIFPITQGILNVTVSGHNYIPHEGEIIVTNPDSYHLCSNSPDALDGNGQDKLVRACDGSLHLVYHAYWYYSGNGGDVFYTRSTDNGLTWTPETYIGVGYEPCISLDDNNDPCVIWSGPSHKTLRFRKSVDGWWSNEYIIDTDWWSTIGPHLWHYPSMKISGTIAHIATRYDSFDLNERKWYYTTRYATMNIDNPVNTFSWNWCIDQSDVSSDVGNAAIDISSSPQCAYRFDFDHVYYKDNSEHSDITGDFNISTHPETGNPSIKSYNNNPFVVWPACITEGIYEIYVLRGMYRQGTSWTGITDITNGWCVYPVSPYIAGPDRCVVWADPYEQEAKGQTPEDYVLCIKDGWEIPKTITHDSGNYNTYDPHGAYESSTDKLYVVYCANYEPPYDIVFKVIDMTEYPARTLSEFSDPMQELSEETPVQYSFSIVGQNPFSKRIALQYELPRESYVLLNVFDVSGRLVKTLENAHKPAGAYSIVWEGHDDANRVVARGVYFVKMTAGDFSSVQKVILVK